MGVIHFSDCSETTANSRGVCNLKFRRALLLFREMMKKNPKKEKQKQKLTSACLKQRDGADSFRPYLCRFRK